LITNFNYYGQADDVTLILCNPSGDQLLVLGTVYDRKVSYKFNALSTLEFIAPYMINGVETPYYSLIQPKRLVLIDGIMCFLITEVTEIGDGVKKYKEVRCQSLESIMNYKKITSFEGTYQFYDALGTSENPGLLNIILEYLPDWSIGTVDTSLALLYRTFNVDDTTLYAFLLNDVTEAYQCIFKFDTLNKTISAYTVENATTNSDIFISYDNLIKEVEVKEITDELITSLTVVGGGDLSINSVNPLGTNTIYDFSYYENTSWMSGSLITALNNWEALVAANQANYASYLTNLQDYNETLITQKAELVDLQSEYKSLENIKIARISQGLDISDINNQLSAKQLEINNKTYAISLTESQIAGVTAILKDINTALSFDTNFSEAAKIELSHFMFGSTYTNENFIQTAIMTNAEIQEQAQGLYDQAVAVLAKISQPRYEFTINSVNFLALQEYQVFINQLELGTIVTLDLGGGSNIYEEDYISSSGSHIYVYPVLLEIQINYDDPSDFNITFSNRLRLDNSGFQLSDLLNNSNNAAISTKFNSEQWSSWTKNYQDDVSQFIESSLDAAKNAVISGSSQNVLIDQTGIRVRNLISASTISSPAVYDPKQLWMNNGIICFTNNNWKTSKLALGEVTVNGIKYFGVVGDALVGKMLIGNNLYMTNENNSFLFDSSGATLTNATLSLTTSSRNNKIFLDPNNGIKIQKNIGGTWTDQLSLDSSGNITLVGKITASSGQIGGWNILSDRLQDNLATPNYIRSDGYIRLGLLTITPTSATFGGTIYADKINGYLTSDQISSLVASKISGAIAESQIGNLPASKITSGTFPSSRILSADGRLVSPVNPNAYLLMGTGSTAIVTNKYITISSGGAPYYISLVGNSKVTGTLDVTSAARATQLMNYNDNAQNISWDDSSLRINSNTDIKLNTYSGQSVITAYNLKVGTSGTAALTCGTLTGNGTIYSAGNITTRGTFYTFDGTNYFEVATRNWVNSKGYITNYYDGSITVTDRVYSNITSSGTSSFQRININNSVYTGGSAGLTGIFTLATPGGSKYTLYFRYGILYASSYGG